MKNTKCLVSALGALCLFAVACVDEPGGPGPSSAGAPAAVDDGGDAAPEDDEPALGDCITVVDVDGSTYQLCGSD
ncbi:MAG TPA: hypothetical protein VFS43_07310 [Polyangiaceae bacterium]|nr:hypothetical protein [Polyangiaceae bacterium]